MDFHSFEFNNNEPIYMQIVELIKRLVASGELDKGMKLPSVREMSTELGVNPNTLQRAYGELEKQGITYTKRGMGSFINENKEDKNELQYKMGLELGKKFLDDMKSIGISKETALGILEKINK